MEVASITHSAVEMLACASPHSPRAYADSALMASPHTSPCLSEAYPASHPSPAVAYPRDDVDGLDLFAREPTPTPASTAQCAPLLGAPRAVGHVVAAAWGYPALHCSPLALARSVLLRLDAAGLAVSQVGFAGSAMARAATGDAAELLGGCPDDEDLADQEGPGPCPGDSDDEAEAASRARLSQLDIVFLLPEATREQLFTTREVALDALLPLLAAGLAARSRHMLAAAYIQNMYISAQPASPADDLLAAFTLHNRPQDPARLTLKFVRRCAVREPVHLVVSPHSVRALPPGVLARDLPPGSQTEIRIDHALAREQPPAPQPPASWYGDKLRELVQASRDQAANCMAMCLCAPTAKARRPLADKQ